MPQGEIQITLKYNGTDVDDGSMPIGDVVSALQGFASAYGKLASKHDPSGEHQVRVAGISKSSFAVIIAAWAVQNHETILKVSEEAARWVVTTLIKHIQLKKETKGEQFSVNVEGNGNTVLVLKADGGKIAIDPDMVPDVVAKLIDSELAKIVAPLRQQRVETATLSAKDQVGEDIVSPVVVTSAEKGFFGPRGEEKTATSRPLSLDGILVSLNKENKRGTFRMMSGKSVPYVFKGTDEVSFYGDFARKGAVRVECIASFDDDLELKGIEISSSGRIQVGLDFPIVDGAQRKNN